jgi:hypothetical protein
VHTLVQPDPTADDPNPPPPSAPTPRHFGVKRPHQSIMPPADSDSDSDDDSGYGHEELWALFNLLMKVKYSAWQFTLNCRTWDLADRLHSTVGEQEAVREEEGEEGPTQGREEGRQGEAQGGEEEAEAPEEGGK